MGKEVDELCTFVLKDEPLNAKALFRRGKARIALKLYEEALQDLRKLVDIEPTSTEGKTLLREAARLHKQTNTHQSKTFAKMCAGLGDLPDRTDRRDDDLVVMPDLEQEAMNIALKHGLPLPERKSKRPPTDDEIVPEPEADGAMRSSDQAFTCEDVTDDVPPS